jgi:uncharacterized SAM-binding protein YcdF (DUF218 family)
MVTARSIWSRRRTKVFLGLLAVLIGLTARLFVWPDVNAPVHADAIVVLAGGGNRDAEAVSLATKGYAPLVAFSIYRGQQCVPSTRTIKVLCFVANPVSTRGEARAVGRLAKKYHLHRIILVVTTPQATRARLRVDRCYSGQLLVEGVSPGNPFGWLYDITYEWGALLKAAFWQTSC